MSRIDDQSGQGATGEGGAQVGQQLRDAGAQLRDQATQQFGQIRDQASQYYEQGRDRAVEYYEQGRQRAMEMEQNLESYIREQPVKSVLIAAGIGCLLGFIWRRS